MSPHKNRHARRQKRIEKQLDSILPSGEAFQGWAIATASGTKQADIIWASDERLKEMEETGDPTTLAPEICVEGMSESNDWEEMEAKIPLYREAGAEEIWIVEQDGRVRFFATEELGELTLAPDVPTSM